MTTYRRRALKVHSLNGRDWLHACVATTLALALYARTACPTIFGGDSAELAAAAALFGVPHPPGYPLYTAVTGIAVALFSFEDAAFGANLMSGVYASLAIGLAWLAARRLGTPRAASWLCAATLAVGATFWSQAVVAEVYTFDALLLFGGLHLLLSAVAADSRTRWMLAGLAVGSWIGHRPLNLIYLPAFALLAWAFEGLGNAWRHLRWIGLGAAASLSVLLYLPLASARDPGIDVGDPETWERFRVVVASSPYLRHLQGGTSELAFGRIARWFTGLPREVGLGSILAVWALVVLWHRGRGQRRLAIALGSMVVTCIAFSARYNVLDVDVFFLPSFAAIALLAALGAEALPLAASRRTWLAAGLLAITAGAGLAWNREANDRSHNRITRLYAEDLLASVSDDAVLFVDGDTTIHALWYLQEVEGRAPDVVVFSFGHLRDWYLEQVERRHPGVVWPEGARRLDPAALVESLGRDRPVFLSLSLQRELLLRPDRHGTINRGITWEVLPRGTRVGASELGQWNAGFFEATLQRLLPLPRTLDMDTKSTVLQYALALSESAALLEQIQQHELARRLYTHVLSLDPDRHEEDVRRDVLRGLGRRIPTLQLGRKAAARLAQL